MFPLSVVAYPFSVTPLHVFEPRYREMLAVCLAGSRELGTVLIERGSEVGGGDVRVGVGVVAEIEGVSRFEDGRYAVVLRGRSRLRVSEWLPDDPYPRASVQRLDDAPPSRAALRRAEAAVRAARVLLSELQTGSASIEPGFDLGSSQAETGWRLCDLAPVATLDHLRLLEIDDPDTRMGAVAEFSDEVARDARLLLGGSTG